MAFIEIKDLKFSYLDDENKPIPTLCGINLSVEKGEFVAVLGHNGSGKSTLAKLITAVLDVQSGSITVDGMQVCSEMSDEDVFSLRRKVGMVFQNPDNQLVATIVEEDIAFGPENLGLAPDEIRKRVDDALAQVEMSEYSRHAPHRLSGGQKQRIAIAGVLAMMPECIIFDEATAMLDPQGRKDVMQMISKIHEQGITVIHITHNMNEAALADRVIVINDGQIYLEGKPKCVFAQVDKLWAVGLEAPQVTELCFELSRAGMDIKSNILDEEECAEKIYSILLKD